MNQAAYKLASALFWNSFICGSAAEVDYETDYGYQALANQREQTLREPNIGGMGTTYRPIMRFAGGLFTGLDWDYIDLSCAYKGAIGGAFSIGFMARWDRFNNWGHLINFGNGPNADNIVVCTEANSPTLGFHIYDGGQNFYLNVQSAIALGEWHEYFFVVNDTGFMSIFKDGVQIGNRSDGFAPKILQRQYMYVAKSLWPENHNFAGHIQDIVVYDQAIDFKTKWPLLSPMSCSGPVNVTYPAPQEEPAPPVWPLLALTTVTSGLMFVAQLVLCCRFFARKGGVAPV